MSEYDVFLSYSRKDSEMMQRVRDSLRNEGLKVWTDESLVPGTPSWKNEIEKAIEASRTLVALLSPDFKQSEWCEKELDYAQAQKRPVFPLLIRGTDADAVPFELVNVQRADTRNDYSLGIYGLLKALQTALGFKDTPLILRIKQEQAMTDQRLREERERQDAIEQKKRVDEEVEKRMKAQQGIDPRVLALANFFDFSVGSLRANRQANLTFVQRFGLAWGFGLRRTFIVLFLIFVLMSLFFYAVFSENISINDLIQPISGLAAGLVGIFVLMILYSFTKSYAHHSNCGRISISETGALIKSPNLRVMGLSNDVQLRSKTKKQWKQDINMRRDLPYDNYTNYNVYTVRRSDGKEFLLSLEPEA